MPNVIPLAQLRHLGLDGGLHPARADESVADDARHVAALGGVVLSDANGSDANVMSQRVAVLYADPRGVYSEAENIDLWDEARDARRYAGPHRVVAHPPCAAWCRWASVREHDGYGARGDDGGCFASALDAVRTWGGVLEHPAHSLAWDEFGLQLPLGRYWSQSFIDPGWVCEVDQAAYGHVASKSTWLYYVGPIPAPLLVSNGRPSKTVKSCNKRERSATPPAFRDALLALVSARELTG